ncbi:hypothetical protein GUITHDRAFT_108657 [Guillardia theta CCMP2712]|uniref:UNC93-like protein MFSD11 n=1 Tax=Guillardia theta (strain CCMP2712) TaxID=905079 RepID=L1JB96_GUITC|nr:hypothetical protein GUITHDRAFT_108657 [Guillardia theta CCMP2712]EKX45389.1 hypothetical protein GUITHDRAFT_108657 [Guillardia theta CCMP2712]|eukprot:XP_005832369.1 hypothetical protein GUITHDRAFT_108657 [Guillardia theta CCMP2712]
MDTTESIRLRIKCLAVGFFCLFAAYKASEQLQTTVNRSSGYVCLLVIYSCLAISSLVAPWIVAKVGTKTLLWTSSLPYVVITASYLLPKNEMLLSISCYAVGIAASTLWTSQGEYVGKCSLLMSQRTGVALTDCTSDLNATFFAIFSASGALSLLFASVVMSVLDNSLTILFTVLTILGVVGVILLALLPSPESNHSLDVAELLKSFATASKRQETVEAGQSEPEDKKGILALGPADAQLEAPIIDGGADSAKLPNAQLPDLHFMIRFLTRDLRMRYIIPVMLVDGARMGFFIGAFMEKVVSGLLGVTYVATVGFISSLALWFAFYAIWCQRRIVEGTGRVVDKPQVQLGNVATGEEGVDSQQVPGTMSDVVIILSGCIVNAIMEPVWNGFLRATLQVYFCDSIELPCAMSSFFVFTSIGFAIQQGISLVFSGQLVAQCVFLLFFSIAAGTHRKP